MSCVGCVGCGKALDSPLDRRNLSNPNAAPVMDLWKSLVESEDSDVNIEILTSGVDIFQAPKMCRKCFLSYSTYINKHKTLVDNLKQAMDKLRLPVESTRLTLPPPAKRVRVEPHSTSGSSSSSAVSCNVSPTVEVNIDYKRKAKIFKLTPTRRHMVKSVVRKSNRGVAQKALSNKLTRMHILNLIGKEINSEVKLMSSDSVNSVLQSNDPQVLKTFSWDMLDKELLAHAPVLRHFLQAAVATKLPRSNTSAVVGMCAGMILNHQNRMMNLLQKVNGILLYSGHCSKKTYTRLQRLNVTVSHSTLLRFLDRIGKDFNLQVKDWMECIRRTLSCANERQTRPDPRCLASIHAATRCTDELSSSESECGSSACESDCSFKSFSPVTSDEECSDSDDNTSAIISDEANESNEEERSDSCPMDDGRESITQTLERESGNHTDRPLVLFHVCGDNIDKSIKPRYTRLGKNKPQDIHYFHHYAIADRIDFTKLSDQVTHTSSSDIKQTVQSLLPSADDDKALKQNVCKLMSRVLFNNLDFFKLSFDGVIEWSIKHSYSKEMSTKSTTYPLGILPNDENKTSEMVTIMDSIQSYVPAVEFEKSVLVPSLEETVVVPSAFVHPILFSGDQKTVARARGAQKASVNSTTPLRRLEGLTPVVADWHAKVKILDVIWKYFYSVRSSSEHGTLYQVRNKLNKVNVVSTPKNDVNACADFIDIITSGLLCAVTIVSLEMGDSTGTPSQQIFPGIADIWTLPTDERKKWLMRICEHVYDTFIKLGFNSSTCLTGSDGIKDCSMQLLRLCCFYLEFSDAIKEGDGERVLRCWKYMIAIFSCSGNKNYACEAANVLIQYKYTLPPRLSAQLLWSRFVNIHGLPRKNIPVDLHMEHLNKVAKNAMITLGSNKTKSTIERIGRAMGTLSPLLDNFDLVNNVQGTSKLSRACSAKVDVLAATNEFVKARCFHEEAGRSYKNISKPRDVLKFKTTDQLVHWLREKLPNQ